MVSGLVLTGSDGHGAIVAVQGDRADFGAGSTRSAADGGTRFVADAGADRRSSPCPSPVAVPITCPNY